MTTPPPEEFPEPLPEPPASDGPPSTPAPEPEPPAPAADVTEPVATESTVPAPVVPPADPTGPPPWPTATPVTTAAVGAATAPPPPPMPGTPPPPAPPASPRRPGAWKQFVVGALIGALVGGATAGGIYLATKDDSTTRTVIVRQAPSATSSSRNTSTIAEPHDIQGILQKVEPAVVAIRTGGAVSGDQNESGGAGTGFVISSDGIIVTNNHVVEGANGEIQVTFTDGTTKSAKVLGRSTDNDLAVLKVDATGLQFAKLGSSDKLQVGDEVVAIGNALALEGGLSVTRGIISAKDRTVPEESGATLYGVLQTDAAINPGNSGGPLVNSDGEVVGINTAIADPQEAQNVGFAIGIDTAKSVIDDLRSGKAVETAFIGVVTQQVTPTLAKEMHLKTEDGVLVRQVTAGSPAADAGIKKNDVIIALAGNAVDSPDQLGGQVRKLKPGDKVDVIYERGGEQQTVSVTIGTRPATNG
jgi:S1-C subfamily serine protease